MEAMAQNKCDHYTRRPGIAALCRLVAQRMAAKDVALDPDDGVVITGGAAETRYVTLRALAANASIYVPAEQMAHYEAVADLAEVTLVPLDLENPPAAGQEGFLLVELSADVGDERYAALATWASQGNITVIADETEQPLLTAGDSRPFASLPGMAERTLTLGGFAHEPGLAAWQVAWFAGPKALATKVRTLKQAMTICSPAPGQYAALAATEEVDA
jgi:aspartate/methionine/tyrosine aminotransferase